MPAPRSLLPSSRLGTSATLLLVACGRPAERPTAAPEPQAEPAASDPSAPKPSPPVVADDTATAWRSLSRHAYAESGRAAVAEVVGARCPALAAAVPPAPDDDDEDDRDVRIHDDGAIVVVVRPGTDGFDDEGESYRWDLEWIWGVDLATCTAYEAAASLYSTSVYDTTDTHWLVGRPADAPPIPDAVRDVMLGPPRDDANPRLATVTLHRSACARPDASAAQVRAMIPKGRTWDLLPLRDAAQPWHRGDVVRQVRAFEPDALDEDGLDWPEAFRDADLRGIGTLHPASGAPRVERSLGDRSLVSVAMGPELAYAIVEGDRHRFVETTHGCLSGVPTWVDAGDDLLVATIAGLDDAPAEEGWMILGRERSGVLVVDLRSGLSHELAVREGGAGKLTTADLRARLEARARAAR